MTIIYRKNIQDKFIASNDLNKFFIASNNIIQNNNNLASTKASSNLNLPV